MRCDDVSSKTPAAHQVMDSRPRHYSSQRAQDTEDGTRHGSRPVASWGGPRSRPSLCSDPLPSHGPHRPPAQITWGCAGPVPVGRLRCPGPTSRWTAQGPALAALHTLPGRSASLREGQAGGQDLSRDMGEAPGGGARGQSWEGERSPAAGTAGRGGHTAGGRDTLATVSMLQTNHSQERSSSGTRKALRLPQVQILGPTGFPAHLPTATCPAWLLAPHHPLWPPAAYGHQPCPQEWTLGHRWGLGVLLGRWRGPPMP